MLLRILMLGDVVGTEGTEFLSEKGRLRKYIKENDISLVIANGENSAPGNGISPESANELLEAGVDIITGGNHSLRKKAIFSMLDDENRIIRPANFEKSPGCGDILTDVMGFRILVINLIGQVFLERTVSSPFKVLDEILERRKGEYDLAVVDFHGEATSEKIAFARYADGRVSAVAGTHTHVQTSDAVVLPGGTGYITDLGMCGSTNGVLGVMTDIVIQRFTSSVPASFEPAIGGREAQGAVFSLDTSTGKCTDTRGIVIK